MTAAIYRYGPPPAWYALAALLRENEKRELWRAYTADALHAHLSFFIPGFDRPAYSALTAGIAQKQDTRTGTQILQDLIGKLEGG